LLNDCVDPEELEDEDIAFALSQNEPEVEEEKHQISLKT
jgi:hypothetical protein